MASKDEAKTLHFVQGLLGAGGETDGHQSLCAGKRDGLIVAHIGQRHVLRGFEANKESTGFACKSLRGGQPTNRVVLVQRNTMEEGLGGWVGGWVGGRESGTYVYGR